MQQSWRFSVRSAAAGLLAMAYSGNDITGPRGGLQLLVSISDTHIEAGETAIFTYAVRNVSRAAISIEYAGCEPFAFIESEAGDPVYPYPGIDPPFFCFDPSPPLVTLAPGEERSRTLEIRGGAAVSVAPDAIATLVPGGYRASAFGGINVRGGSRVDLRSPVVRFEVAP
jgi:hypothetical protein